MIWNILKRIDLFLLALIAFCSVVLSVLDFFDVTNILSSHSALFTLFLLGAIGLHLIMTHVTQDNFQSIASKKLNSLNVTDFRIYSNSMEIESRLAEKILSASTSVCDLSWKNKISEGFSSRNRQLSHGHLDECIAEASSRISYREIFIFNDVRRIEKLFRRLSENKDGYSCSYYKDDEYIPRIQFVIVDNEEVFFFASSSDSILCSFQGKELAKVFQSYYEVLWDAAIPIKRGKEVNKRQVAIIRNKINKMKSKNRR